jgi:hypothetical protein
MRPEAPEVRDGCEGIGARRNAKWAYFIAVSLPCHQSQIRGRVSMYRDYILSFKSDLDTTRREFERRIVARLRMNSTLNNACCNRPTRRVTY